MRHKAENAGEKFVHSIPSYQPLIDPKAKFLIEVVQQSSQVLSDDSARREAVRRPRREFAPLTPELPTAI